jgi:hypothetical protein
MRELVMRLKRFSTLSVVLILAASQANARIPGRGGAPAAGPGNATGVDVSTPSIGVPSTTVSVGRGENCEPTDTQGYVSLNFIRNIVDPSVRSPNELKIVKIADGSYQVDIPKYIKACTDLSFEVVNADNNYFVRVKNNFEFTPQNIVVNSGEDFDKLTMDEKYYRCIEKKGLLKNDAFDRAKAEQTGDVSYGASSRPFSVDIGNQEESVNVYFGSAKATGYGHPYDAGIVSPRPSGWSCVVYENFNSESPERLFTSEKDRIYDRALRVCETESAERILEELYRLRESSAGNFRALEKILEQAFDKAQEKRVEEVYARMEEIEDAMRPDDEGNFVSEEVARDYAKEYSALSKELNRIVIQPSVARIEKLQKMRNRDNKDEVDKELKDLREKISKFHDDKEKGLSFVYDTLEEYALVESARDIRGLWLASKYYGGKGGPMKIEAASRKVVNDLKHFETNYLNHWEAKYALSRGSRAPLDAQRRQIEFQKRRLDQQSQRYTQSVQQCQQYCTKNFMRRDRNPARCSTCQKSMSRNQQNFLRQRSRMLGQMRTSANRFSEYQTTLDDYLASQIQDNSFNSDPFATDFYDPFSPQNFSMGGDMSGGGSMDWMYNMQGGGMQNQMMRGPAQIQAPGAFMGNGMGQNMYATPFRQ